MTQAKRRTTIRDFSVSNEWLELRDYRVGALTQVHSGIIDENVDLEAIQSKLPSYANAMASADAAMTVWRRRR